jgi:hypothetical protein
MNDKEKFIQKDRKADREASKMVDKLNTQIKKIDLVRLRGVLVKKVLEFNDKKKEKKIEEYNSSDLS